MNNPEAREADLDGCRRTPEGGRDLLAWRARSPEFGELNGFLHGQAV